MLFNSYTFLFLFMPLVLLGYQILGQLGYRRLVLAWLVLASFVYYAWWNVDYVVLLVASIVVNYAVGRLLMKMGGGAAGKGVLAAGIIANLVTLGYYKYTGLLLSTMNAFTGSEWDAGSIILPLAISFYTFQQIAFLVDAHRNEVRFHSFLDYCLFVMFFPQLIAGPIVHHGEMLPQFEAKTRYTISAEDFSIGSTIFFIGLFKKVMIADFMAELASPIFAEADSGVALTTVQAWTGALAYTFQIYFDFSGYSDMAIGLARIFGILLPLNFNSPYKASSITQFWRCWHLTLSRFLRDYLYIPLGGNRKGPFRRYVNLFITMLLGGLWHGASWTFLWWGGLHGLYLCVHHGWRALLKGRGWTWTEGMAWRVAAVLLTNLAVIIGWVFFRAVTFDGAQEMLTQMFNPAGLLEMLKGPYNPVVITWFVALALVCWFLPNSQQIMREFKPAYDFDTAESHSIHRIIAWFCWRPTVINAVLVAAVGFVCILSLSKVSEFIYYQF